MTTRPRQPAKHPATEQLPGEPSTSSRAKHMPTQGLYGWITHTELASSIRMRQMPGVPRF